jgi:hypothetical protein
MTPRVPVPGFEGRGNAASLALDFGLLSIQNWMFGKTSIGLTLQNIGPDIYYYDIDESEHLPLTLKIGLAHNLRAKTFFSHSHSNHGIGKIFIEQPNITISCDFIKNLYYQKESYYLIGCEFNPLTLISARVGYFIYNQNYQFQLPRKSGITYGIGLNIRDFRIDVGTDANTYDFETTNWHLSTSYIF